MIRTITIATLLAWAAALASGCQTDTVHVDAIRPAVETMVPEYVEYVENDEQLTDAQRNARITMAQQLRMLVADIDAGEVSNEE